VSKRVAILASSFKVMKEQSSSMIPKKSMWKGNCSKKERLPFWNFKKFFGLVGSWNKFSFFQN
jgi:hypothetical protein